MFRKHLLRLRPSAEYDGAFIHKWLRVSKSRNHSLRGINNLRITINQNAKNEQFAAARLNLHNGAYEREDLVKPLSRYSEYLRLRGIFNIFYGTTMHRRINKKKVTTLRC